MVFAVVGRLVPNLQGRLGGFDRCVGFKIKGGDGDNPATTPVRQESGGFGGFGFRFFETPARFGEPGLELARSLPNARDFLQTPLEAFGETNAIETLDLTQSSLKAQGPQNGFDTPKLGLLRLELGTARDELVARLHELLDAAGPFLHPRRRTWTSADASP